MAASEAMVAAGEHLSSSRPVRRVKTRPAARIPLCVEPPPPFAEGPGPGRDWWEKALSEKSFRAGKHENSQQNQSVGAKSRTTTFSPFGELIRTTGTMAKANPFRFSTKYQDDESDFLYYGYRSFNPSSGRWLNRDPMGERGGRNLYGFVAINPLSRIDALGLYAFDMEVKVYIEGTRVTFGGRTFNTGTKVDHVVHVDTDTDSITQSKFIGTTIEYDSSGNEIGSGTAPSTGLTASIKCKLTKTRFGCCKQCDVNMSGSAADPLFHGFAPGIDYEFQLIVTVCPGATALSYFGSHDGYPSYDFSVAGANVHHYSHVTAGTSPLSLYPSTKGIYFGSTLWLMTGL